MEEELSEYEIEHLRKLSVLQRTAAAISRLFAAVASPAPERI